MLLPHTSQQEADRFITRVKRDFNKKNSDGLQLSVSLGCSVKTEKETDIRSVMTYDRSYRKALPTADAKQELLRGAGGQFDPDVVTLFLKLLQEGKIPSFQ